ncbi:MAG: hypothetical protein WDW36_010098 [Sanguina aurantia]
MGPAPATDVFYDEEECLSFDVFVAELELLVGNKQSKPDGVSLLQLLQKMIATINRTERKILKMYQKRCEGIFTDLLAVGASPVLRRLICGCLVKFYVHGDLVAVYGRVAALQTYLAGKEGMSRSTAEVGVFEREGGEGGGCEMSSRALRGGAGRMEERAATGSRAVEFGGVGAEAVGNIRVGQLDVLAALSRNCGRYLASASVESLAIAGKTVNKSGNQAAVRGAALRLACAVVDGLHPLDRNTAPVQAEAYALLLRNAKDRSSDDVRCGCMALLASIARGGGAALWRDGGYYYEEGARLAAFLLDDASLVVRDAAAAALGEMAAAARHGAVAQAIAAEKRPPKKLLLERLSAAASPTPTPGSLPTASPVPAAAGADLLGGSSSAMFRCCLVTPLVEAVVAGRREAVLSLAGAWRTHIASLQQRARPSPGELQALGMALIGAADACAKAVADRAATAAAAAAAAAAAGAPEGELLGSALTGSELPLLQSLLLSVLRGCVAEALPEAFQRSLLEGLVVGLAAPWISVPAAILTMEGMRCLMCILGEVGEDVGADLERVLLPQVSSGSAAARSVAASTLGALSAATPAAASRLLEGACERLLEAAVQIAGAGAGRSATSARPFADRCHGCALAVSTLLLSACHSPLGCPARLLARVASLARRLVAQPAPPPSSADAAGAGQPSPLLPALCEAGFLLLGSLSCCGAAYCAGEEGGAGLEGGAGGQQQQQGCGGAGPVEAAAGDEGQEGDGGHAPPLLPALIPSAPMGPYFKPSSARHPQGGRHPHTSAPPGPDPPNPKPTPHPNRLASPGGDADLAAALTCRAVALQALAAHLTAFPALASHPQLVEVLLLPVMELLPERPFLTAPAAAKGGPAGGSPARCAPLVHQGFGCDGTLHPAPAAGHVTAEAVCGLLAACACTFTLRLIELLLLLPHSPQLEACGGMAMLVRSCTSAVAQAGAFVGAELLGRVVLRPALHGGADSVLGPWMTGKEEGTGGHARLFSGDRGAPAPPPWQPSLTPAPALSTAPNSPPSGRASTAAASRNGGSNSSPGGGGGGGGGHNRSTTGAAAPQAVSLGPALVKAQMLLLGRRMSGPEGLMTAPPELLVRSLTDAVTAAKAAAAASAAASRKDAPALAAKARAVATAAASAALLAFGPSSGAGAGGSGGGGSSLGGGAKKSAAARASPQLADSLLTLANALLDEGATSVEQAALSRAAAELMGCSAAVGTDGWASQLVLALCGEIKANTAAGQDAGKRAVLCLALGAVHRCKGGLSLQGVVAPSVEALLGAASRPAGASHLWALHGLWLVANAAGPSFTPHVRASLQLAQQLLVTSFDSPALKSSCARLANSMVAVLGPELSLGSAAYTAAKVIISEADTLPTAPAEEESSSTSNPSSSTSSTSTTTTTTTTSGGSASAADLEAVLFVQQLVLFAPHAVPAAKHVAMLTCTLRSSSLPLRSAAAATLRHLAERSPRDVGGAGVERLLVGAMDSEGDAAVEGQLRETLSTLLHAAPPSATPYWLALLGEVALSSTAAAAARSASGPSGSVGAAAAQQPSRPAGGGVEREFDREDDDEEGAGRGIGAGRRAPDQAAAARGGGGGLAGAAGRSPTACRLQGPRASPTVSRRNQAAHLDTPTLGVRHTVRELWRTGCGWAASRRSPFVSLRLRTRVFAATCLLDMFHTQANSGSPAEHASPEDSTPGGQQRGQPGTLAHHLQALVDLGFKLATGPVGALAPLGVALLEQALRAFAGVEDPLAPGSRLMAQCQTGLLSPVHSAPSSHTRAWRNSSSPSKLCSSPERSTQSVSIGGPGREGVSPAPWVMARCRPGVWVMEGVPVRNVRDTPTVMTAGETHASKLEPAALGDSLLTKGPSSRAPRLHACLVVTHASSVRRVPGSVLQGVHTRGVPRRSAAWPHPLSVVAASPQQAQLVSSLRAALSPTAPPTLAIAGGTLATTFLESGLAAGDSQVMKRLMELLTSPLTRWDAPMHASYAEWVGARSRVALLHAHAQCAVIAARGRGRAGELCASIVAKAQSPMRPRLLTLWFSLLQDHLLISSQHPALLNAYTSPVIGQLTSQLAHACAPLYTAACAAVMDALTSGLPAPATPTASTPAGTAVAASGRTSAAVSTHTAAAATAAAAAPIAPATQLQLYPNTDQLFPHAQLLEVLLGLASQAALQLSEAVAIVTSAAERVGSSSGGGSRASSVADGGASGGGGGGGGGGSVSSYLDDRGGAAVAEVQAACGCYLGRLQGLGRAMGGGYLAAGLVPAQASAQLLRQLAAVCAGCLTGLAAAAAAPAAPQRPGQHLGTPHTGGSASAAAALHAVMASLLQATADLMGLVVKQAPCCQLDEPGLGLAAVDLMLAGARLALGPGHVSPPPTRPTEHVWRGNGSSRQQDPFQGLSMESRAGPVTASPAVGAQLDQWLLQLLASAQGFVSRASRTALRRVQPSLLAASLRLVMLPSGRPSQAPLTAAGGRLLQQLAAVAATATSNHHAPPPTPPSHGPSEDGCSDASSEAIGQALTALLHSLQLNIAAAGADPPQHSHSQEQHSGSRSLHQAGCGASRRGAGGEQGDASSTATLCAQLTALLCASAYFSQPPATQSAAGIDGDAKPACVGASSERPHPPDGTPGRASQHGLRSALLLCVRQWQQPHRPAGVRLAVLGALRALMQEAAAEQPQGCMASWSHSCAASSLPVAAASLHATLATLTAAAAAAAPPVPPGSGAQAVPGAAAGGSLSEGEASVAVETLRVLVVMASSVTALGQRAQETVLELLVPLLVECASPPPPAASVPALREFALKLVSTLPAAASLGPAFRAVLMASHPAHKARLQGALKESAAAAAAAASAAASHPGQLEAIKPGCGVDTPGHVAGQEGDGGGRAPTIQLKMTFGAAARKL